MGGKGANQAVAAAKLGADVMFVACVGDDAFGLEAIRQYQAQGICTDHVRRVKGHATGTAAIVVDDCAENCIIVIPGANAMLSTQDVQLAAMEIERCDAVVCQLETPMSVTRAAFQLARAAGKLTVLTPAPAVELPDELLRLCDVCVPNRSEIELLVGSAVDGPEDALSATELLKARGVKSVALTMGSQGVFILDDNHAMHIPALKVNAMDTTGAGDAFSAALSVFLCEGYSLRDAAERACVAGALTVTQLGTHAAFPQRDALLKTFQEQRRT
jgi:ribokinase